MWAGWCGEPRARPRTEARLHAWGGEPRARPRTHGVESPEARLRMHGVESPEHACARTGTRCWQGCQDGSVGKGVFSTNEAANRTPTCSRAQLDSPFSHTESNAKWIEYLKAKPKTAELLEENTKEASWQWSRHWFIGYVPKAQPATPRP